MKPEFNLTGKRFGRWLVIDQRGNEKYGKARWWCRCDCGTEKLVGSKELRQGLSKSCGCAHKLSPIVAVLNSLFSNTKTTAKRRNIEFTLSVEQFSSLVQKDCFYCGQKPTPIAKSHYRAKEVNLFTNGLDRLNSGQGYIIGNVVPCCKNCNFAKNELSLRQFAEWMSKVYNRMENWIDCFEQPGFTEFNPESVWSE